jgi:hypothetical protein
VALALAAESPAMASRAAPPQRPPADPPAFASAIENQQGDLGVWLTSVATGGMRLVARANPDYVDNGFALAPDAKSVFVVSWPERQRQPAIVEVSARTRRARVVAGGANPAVSPDGRYLAYDTGSNDQRLAVLDLRTGRHRVIDAAALIGPDATFLNGSVSWLGDGTQFVAMAEADPVPVAAGRLRPGPPRICGSTSAHLQCLIVVQAANGRLTARRVFVRTSALVLMISGQVTRPSTLLLAGLSNLWAVRIGAARVVAPAGLATLPRTAQTAAIAPAGDRVLYLASTPTSLWIARICHGRLTHRRKLYTNSPRHGYYDIAAW